MRAVVCNEFGPLDTLVVEGRPDLEPGEGMVRIDVAGLGAAPRGVLRWMIGTKQYSDIMPFMSLSAATP